MSKKSLNPSNLNFFHSVPIQIRFNDIDKLDHATNSVYQQYLDLGRMDYFDSVLKEVMEWKVEGLILVSISIDFISPVKLYDRVEVRTKITRMGNKSLDMKQEIYNISTGQVSASSSSVMVGYRGLTEESIPIPLRWRDGIRAFEKDVLFEV